MNLFRSSKQSIYKNFISMWKSVGQSCPTLCDPMDCSPPHSSVHGVSQSRILEWVSISFSSRHVEYKRKLWILHLPKQNSKTKFSDCLSLFSLAACPLSGVEFVSLKDQPDMWFPQPCFSLPFPADIPIALLLLSFPVFLLYVTPGLLFVPFPSCRSASGSLFTEAFSHHSGCCRH